MSKLAIRNGHLLTITKGEIPGGTILIEDGKIVAIGSNLPVPEGYCCIDAAGMTVTPGLIDAHSHLGLMGDPSIWATSETNEKSGPVQSRLRGIESFNPRDPAIPVVRSGGVTAVYTGPGSSNIIGGTGFACKLRPAVDAFAMLIPGSEGMKMALGENPKRNYEGKEKGPGTRMGSAATLRAALIKTQNYMSSIHEAIEQGKSIPGRDLDLEPLIPVLEGKMKARIHAHRADDILTAIRISEEFRLKYVIEHCTEGYLIADILAEKKVEATVGPLLMEHSKHELWEVSLQNPGILAKAGVKVSIQVDSAADTQYLRMETGIAVREGMDRQEALKAITINPAEILGLDKQQGSLEVGKDADIAIFDGDPLSNLTHCLYTIIDGVIVWQKD
ncbi:MAG: amidohydrolase [Symbiobacteriaceae bacterium]|nr:amidohydrolase [Symbiobacteriaceae bacterium]